MRCLVVLVAGCTFNVPVSSSDDARTDAAQGDAGGGDVGGGGDAAVDGAPADAPMMAQVSFVQGDSGAGAAGQAILTLLQPIAAGDLCVVGVGTNGGSIQSVTDSGGNTYASVNTAGGATVYVASNMQASVTDTITVRFSGGTGYAAAAAVYRGLATTDPVEVAVASMGSGTTLDSGSASTVHPHDLLVGVALSDGTMAAGNGFTRRVGGTYSMIEDREVTAAGTYNATASSTQSVNWRLSALALRAAD